MTANIRHSSETFECLTPTWLVEKARRVLGEFDIDPASTPFANEAVGASRIHTVAENGLWQEWHGRAFLNPPGGLVDSSGRTVIRKSRGREGCSVTGECGLEPGHVHPRPMSSAAVWWRKLTWEWRAGRVSSYCIPRDRIDFDVVVEGKRVSRRDPTHSNVLVLVGGGQAEQARFREAFAEVGYVGRIGALAAVGLPGA